MNTKSIIFLFLFMIQSAFAQDSFSISAQNGFVRRYGVENNGYSFGIAGRYYRDSKGAEIKIDYLSENYPDYKVKAKTLHLSASYMYFPTSFVYFLIGAGVNFEEYIEAFEPIPDEYKKETIGIILTGMGTLIPINRLLSCSLDIRYIMQDNDFEYLPLHKDFNYYYQLNFFISCKIFN